VNGWWSGHKVIDPTEMEARFATEDGLGFMEQLVSEELSEETQEQLDRVKNILCKLPAREADFVDLYYFKHRKQTDIAQIFGVSQPTVCYRLQRATDRIEFLFSLPDTDEEEIREVLSDFLPDPQDVDIMVLMYQTTCQSEVAKQIGASQGLVRHRFIRSIDKMDKAGGMNKFVEVFRKVQDNLNILREVQRPSWNLKRTHVVL